LLRQLSAISRRLGNVGWCPRGGIHWQARDKPCRSAQLCISKFYSLRTIPNCIASRLDRYHS